MSGAVSAGVSRLLSGYSLGARQLGVANEAVRWSDSDPESHYARGQLLLQRGRLPEATKELERAVALRPSDYFLRLELGRALDQANRKDAAIESFRQAIRLAPYYAQPHWQLGNSFLRAGRLEEAFAELRRAAASDQTLLPAAIDLAWGAFNGDARATEAAIQPQTFLARQELARFFANHNKASDAVKLFRQLGQTSDKDRQAILNDLLAAKQFPEAYDVWLSGREETGSDKPGKGAIVNGGFEHPIMTGEAGFDWQFAPDLTTVRATIDAAEKRSGAQSLSLEFSGDYGVQIPVVSQLVIVEAKTHYQLRFAARVKDLVTGGLPLFVVTDATSRDGRALGQSKPLLPNMKEWQQITFDFTTGETTTAVLVSLKRQPCSSGPCPVFGRVWLDDFSLQKS